MSALAHAQPTITGVTASIQKTEAGKTTVKIVVNGKGLEAAICALRVNQGDGTSVVREMDGGRQAVFPLMLWKTYARPGVYRISVQGVRSGLYLKCLGEARTTVRVK